ncbi:acetate kinase [Spirulina sp. CS-785/01]|uniref:acetate/propionate family kinase n=1 Tax=Spirulina sp. CS-785/01 TaxID=3021716 RepID=UPI00232DAACA|nr:acetate kinase [Spirulina sp. CS-785/01]MDB9313856.1 acetate kinase [Spirulina sp. CS-785/01]
MKILVHNAGSSSQKSCLYDLPDETPLETPLTPLWQGTVDWQGQDNATLKVKAQGKPHQETLNAPSRRQGIAALLDTLTQGETAVLAQLEEIEGVGHRVVHGGADYTQATLITPEVQGKIAELSVLAPVHNPVNLAGIEAMNGLLPDVPQVALFDTAFHSQMPEEAAVYPLPYEWYERGIRRYGFHGISHEYCAQRAAVLLGRPLEELRLITCHLGNGCSLAAIRGGQSVQTTMGFTPLEGLMMGTRSGSIDPAIALHLMREYQLNLEQVDTLLNKQSGIKGITGESGDMRDLLRGIESGKGRAKLAFAMYIHRLQSAISALLPALGGLDALIFAGGVGENAPLVRAKTCQGLEFLGVQLAESANEQSPQNQDIATPESRVRVLVIPTQEDWAIARATYGVLRK